MAIVSKCYKCGPMLANEPWVSMRIGRICAGRMGVEPPREIKERAEKMADPKLPRRKMGVFDIHLERDSSGYATANVPHAIVRHSPSGFEWGHGGSGSADLALNILAPMIGQEAAERYYQQFKWDVISRMPIQGGVIEEGAIGAWLRGHGVEA